MIQSAPHQRRVVQQSPQGQRLVSADGELIHVPSDWIFVGSGDPALPRLIAAGPAWQVVVHRGTSRFTTGVWVPRRRLEVRKSPDHARLIASRVLALLDFPPRHQEVAGDLARQIAEHLAQQALPDEGRSLQDADLELALLQWLDKHLGAEAEQGASRRRKRSRWQARALAILAEYRIGLPRDQKLCPLARALALTAERC